MENRKVFILMLVVSIVIGFAMVKFIQFKYDLIVEGFSQEELGDFSDQLSDHRLSLLVNLLVALIFVMVVAIAFMLNFPDRTKNHIVGVLSFLGGITALVWMFQFTKLLSFIF